MRPVTRVHVPFGRWFLAGCLWGSLVVLPGCSRQQPAVPGGSPAAPTPASAPAAPTASTPPPATAVLRDVSERTPDYLIGISFPPVANRYPPLAAELERYAGQARNELMQAVAGRGKGEGQPPYELVLPFSELVVSPTLVAVGVDGSSYTGGAHGAPLIARWVWLPQQEKRLTADALVADSRGWEAISRLVREQLHTALSQRIDADRLSPEERVGVLKAASRMIDEGTRPDPAHFAQFEPLVDAGGRIRALRFVFAPYEVGPYSDGTQTVDIPAAQLLPYIAPPYRGLFQGG